MKKNKAFTLIETLVVISIIGLLSSAALVSVNQAGEKARIARLLSFSSPIKNGIGHNIVGEWLFENNIDDTSGANNVTAWSSGGDYKNNTASPDLGNAGVFSGNYVNITPGPSMSSKTGKVSAEAWMKTSEFGSNYGWGLFSLKNGPGIWDNGFSLIYFSTTMKLIYNKFCELNCLNVDRYFSSNKWNYIAATFDYSKPQDEKAKLYINGVRADCSLNIDPRCSQEISPNILEAYIGQGCPALMYFSQLHFIGLIDNVRIYYDSF